MIYIYNEYDVYDILIINYNIYRMFTIQTP